MNQHDNTAEDIAIVGMSGRLPGRSLDAWWPALTTSADGPASPAAPKEPDDASCFDADFFGIPAREAQLVGPPHRVLLECAWEALESASCNPDARGASMGVFASVDPDDSYRRHLLRHPHVSGSFSESAIQILTSHDQAPLWVSQKLSLQGPCLCVGSGECSPIASVHIACQSLRDRECDMAIAGGVAIIRPPGDAMGVQTAGGHWSAGFVVLKRLATAVADRDSIRAVIRGSAYRRTGTEKIDFTPPHVLSLAQTGAECHRRAGVRPDTLCHIEVATSGSVVSGTRIESMLTEAFERGSSGNQSVAPSVLPDVLPGVLPGVLPDVLPDALKDMGSIRAMAGLLRVTRALEGGVIPRTDAFSPRRAAVMVMGLAGTSAHVVLEEAAEARASGSSRLWQVLGISARSAQALDAMSANLRSYLVHHPDVHLADVAFSLHTGRKSFGYRKAMICRTTTEAVECLGYEDSTRCHAGFAGSARKPVVFMFPGAGAQYVRMGRDLYESEAVFRDEFDKCCEIVQSQERTDLRSALYPTDPNASLDQPVHILTGLFAVEYSLARLWMHLGVEPESMIGHSLGEYVAACLSGVFGLEDALTLVALRGRLFETLPAGAMLSVSLGESEVLPYLNADLSLAGINAPRLCVVSGSVEAVKELQRTLSGRDVDSRLLQVSRAGHSSFVTPIMEEFAGHVGALTLGRPRIPFLSNYTGAWIQDAEAADPRYWTAHLRHTVRFAAGCEQLLLDPDRVFLEVGPGRTLGTLARQHPQAAERVILSSMRHIKDPQSDVDVFLQALGKLWTAGVHVDNAALYVDQDRRRLALPTYPFERRRHWVDAASLPAEEPRAIQGPSHQEFVEPRNEIEEAVARIWRDLLGTRLVSVDRSFGDLGGNESLLPQMQHRMAQEFGLVPVARCSLRSTIADLADLVAERALEEIPQEELSRALADLDLRAI